MSPVSVYLARLIGLYCIVVAVAMVVRRKETIAAVDAMMADSGLMMLTGVLALAAGLAVVVGHNVWTGSALDITVTVLGWGVAAKGALLLIMTPDQVKRMVASMRFEALFNLYMVICMALGAGLVWLSLPG